MDNPERPAPADPPATHWNTSRDPAWSFACPYCGQGITLKEVLNNVPDRGIRSGDLVAICRSCARTLLRHDWKYLKATELSQE